MRLFRPTLPGAASPPPTPRHRRGVWRLAFLLTAAIFGLLLLDNRQYLFETKLYENTDHASDSLMVREAKHTVLLHGHYSQWRFYHPGPALLDTLAAGEELFYDGLGLVPTPYNGQLLMLCLVMTLFFSLALSVFAQQIGGEKGGYLFFLPLALLFAIWHYGAVGGQVFLDAWPAYPPVMALLCLMVMAAAVAAGGGWELPVLVATGGWLVHNHAAQPLFVVPLTLLAYVGLLVKCREQAARAGDTRDLANTLTAAWRTFPRAHGVAAALLTCFILPLCLDALHGRDSNLARILEFMRTHRGPGRKFMRSLCYFLTFGGHDPSQLGTREFGHYSAASILSFVRVHWGAYTFWTVALLGTPILFFAANRHLQKRTPPEDKPPQGTFLRWFYAVLAVTWGLSLVWGMRQDGPMYYYNAYFNYSVYYGLALGLAAAFAGSLMVFTAASAAQGMRPIISMLLWIGVAGAAILQGSRFRVTAFGTPEDAASARTVERAAADLPTGAICFLDCRPWENWTTAIAVVLELERLGHKVRVNDNWEIMFGEPRTIQHEKLEMATPLARWMVVLPDKGSPDLSPGALLSGCRLSIKRLPDVNPNGQRISFSPGGNSDVFAFFGWSPGGNDWSWSDQRTALIAFHPLALPGGATGVDLLISAWTSPPPGRTDLQSVIVQFNDTMIETLHLPLISPDIQPLRVRISSILWQAALAKGEARLQFHFPDAKSPYALGLGTDTRLLGGGFRSIEFQPAFP